MFLDCSQPSMFFSIDERAMRTARELDASAKRKKQGGPLLFALKNREAVDSLVCFFLSSFALLEAINLRSSGLNVFKG